MLLTCASLSCYNFATIVYKLETIFAELRGNVLTIFREYETAKLSDIWITLQLIYNEVIKHNETNKYRLPHTNKKKLTKEGRLPENIGIDSTVYKVLVEILIA